MLLGVVASCALIAGCVTSEGLARTRAANEFHCPEDQIVLTPQESLSDGTYDVNACGHRARYTCLVAQSAHGCMREPDPPERPLTPGPSPKPQPDP
jgi:hypothetical protein